MNKDIFQKMYSQMTPDDHILEELDKKIKVLELENRSKFSWKKAVVVFPTAAAFFAAGFWAINAYTDFDFFQRGTTDEYYASNSDNSDFDNLITTKEQETEATTQEQTIAVTKTSVSVTTTQSRSTAVTTTNQVVSTTESIETTASDPSLGLSVNAGIQINGENKTVHERITYPQGDAPINAAYPTFIYKKNEYTSVLSKSYILNSKFIDAKLASVTLQGDPEHANSTTQATIYEINGLSKDCYIALKYAENNEYYVFINETYKPKNFNELISNAGIFKYLENDKTNVTMSVEGEAVIIPSAFKDKAAFISCFNSALNASNLQNYTFLLSEQNSFLASMVFDLQYKIADCLDFTVKIGIMDDGYLFVQSEFGEHVFNIGKQSAENIIKSITAIIP